MDSWIGKPEFKLWISKWGLFTQPDTVIREIYHPQDLNHYMFESGNPFKLIDPSGHFTFQYNGAVIAGGTPIWAKALGLSTSFAGLDYVAYDPSTRKVEVGTTSIITGGAYLSAKPGASMGFENIISANDNSDSMSGWTFVLGASAQNNVGAGFEVSDWRYNDDIKPFYTLQALAGPRGVEGHIHVGHTTVRKNTELSNVLNLIYSKDKAWHSSLKEIEFYTSDIKRLGSKKDVAKFTKALGTVKNKINKIENIYSVTRRDGSTVTRASTDSGWIDV